jgi:hypothetical protein
MIMKRTALIVGFGALVLALVLVVPGVSQMGTPMTPVQSPTQNQQAGNPAMGPMAAMSNPGEMEMEIHLLRALDMAGLSKDQLSKLQAIVASVKGARDALYQTQQQLRDFLASFQGTPADFEKAVAPFDQKVQEAQKALQDALTSGVSQVKNMLTISQGEALMQALRRMPHQATALNQESMQMDSMMQQMQQKMQEMMQAMQESMQSMPGMRIMMGMKGKPARGQMQQMMERMQGMMTRPLATERMGWGQMLLAHLDLIDRVLTEKLAGMKG